MRAVTLHHGDALAVLRTLPDASIDAVVTDPPYGLGFMGQKWDTYANETGRTPSSKRHKFDHVGGNHNPSNSADAARTRRVEAQRFGAWCSEWTVECLRVLKPGGHMLAFGGARTWHRLAVAIEDAGFEMRDTITWHYGSGFPKSLDVSKAIDKATGATREVVATVPGRMPQAQARDWGNPGVDNFRDARRGTVDHDITAPATDAARQWQGWGTALKPASEPIIVARKPLAGTVAACVLAHGTGALNIDACRVAHDEPAGKPSTGLAGRRAGIMGATVERHRETTSASTSGRWPTNVIFAHAPGCGPDEAPGECVDGCPVAELDAQSGTLKSGLYLPEHADNGKTAGTLGAMSGRARTTATYGDSGGASRFFPTFRYQAKAPTRERPKVDGVSHPTVKPLALIRWLVRLVTPPGGTVLDPFAGSGTTGEACVLEGFDVTLIEREATYLPLIEHRLGEGLEVVEHADEGEEIAPESCPVLVAIETAEPTRDAFNALHRAHKLVWTDAHTAAARARLDAAGVVHR